MSGSQGKDKPDPELDAIGSILGALERLEGESIQRVLDYVLTRLSLTRPARLAGSSPMAASAAPISTFDTSYPARLPSIRDLKEEKNPESSNQMAALVAYFLSEMAREADRKDAIGTPDLEKYFKQAGFRLPKVISKVLPNAAAAGYFEAVGNGLYRLNAIGYNLVVHGLPRLHEGTSMRAKVKTRAKVDRKKSNTPVKKKKSGQS